MMLPAIEEILKRCSGVDVIQSETKTAWHGGQPLICYDYVKTGKVVVPKGIFIEVTATATKGTIAEVVDIEVETYEERYNTLSGYEGNKKIVTYESTLIYRVENRKQLGRIKCGYTKYLPGVHQTKYVRSVKKHKQVEIKNPVNKFKQELQKGDWVIGVKQGGSLGIGRITRWTNHNVWGVTGDDLDDKSKEFMFASINETFTMPDDEHVPLLTMAVLKGWDGR